MRNVKAATKNTLKDKKAKIQEAALRAFAQKGFQGATIAEIASIAGVAEGTIYNYYRNKQDLLFAVAEIVISEQFVSQLRTPTRDFRSSLRIVVEERLRFGLANSKDLLLLLSEARRDPDLRKRYFDEVIRRVSVYAENVLTKEIAEGTVRNLNPRIAVRLMMANIIGLVLVSDLERDADGETFSAEELAEHATDIFLTGILRDRS